MYIATMLCVYCMYYMFGVHIVKCLCACMHACMCMLVTVYVCMQTCAAWMCVYVCVCVGVWVCVHVNYCAHMCEIFHKILTCKTFPVFCMHICTVCLIRWYVYVCYCLPTTMSAVLRDSLCCRCFCGHFNCLCGIFIRYCERVYPTTSRNC